MKWRRRDVAAQALRRVTQLGVFVFVIYAAMGGFWRNYKVAHNSSRAVEMMEGEGWATAYRLNESALALLGEPYEASFQFLGMPWAATIGGLETVDPILGLSMAVSTGGLSLFLGALGTIGLAVLFGKVFCSHICPMRLLFEVGQTIRGGLLWLGAPLPHLRPRPRLGGWILLGGLLASMSAGIVVWFFILPYVAVVAAIFLGVTAGLASGLLVIPVMWWWIDVLVAPGTFCRNICPQGFLLGMLGRLSLLKVRAIASKTCPPNCHTCSLVCPYGLSPRAGTHTHDCDNCGQCVAICPERRLTRRVRLPVLNSLVLALGIGLAAAPAIAEAHHNKGLPHYGYYENYPQVPVEEHIVVDGRWEMGATLFNFQGMDRRQATTPNDVKLFVYVYDLQLDTNYTGRVEFELVDDEGDRVGSFYRDKVDMEMIYATRETMPATGDYTLVARLLDIDGQPEVRIRFHIELSTDAVPWVLLLALTGPLAPLFVLVLLGRSRRGRSRRLKSQLKADVAEIAAHRGIPS